MPKLISVISAFKTPLRVLLVASAGLACTVGASAQTVETQCILAGRINDAKQWAPQSAGVALLDAQGRAVKSATAADLAKVTQVRVSKAALMSACNGKTPIAEPTDSYAKSPVPAVAPDRSLLAVSAVNLIPLKVGGELVELKVAVPVQRVVAVLR